ncbi:MAG: DUF2934 domain-containing protein [Acidaminococcaceae bacterium]|nr:DUF2934 domain-containing protein [Acidaminococcaceae bacterium]
MYYYYYWKERGCTPGRKEEDVCTFGYRMMK